jgi:hypothetical protein
VDAKALGLLAVFCTAFIFHCKSLALSNSCLKVLPTQMKKFCTGLVHAKKIFATNYSVLLLSTSSKFYFDGASALFYTVLACALAVFKRALSELVQIFHIGASALNFTVAQCPPLPV